MILFCGAVVFPEREKIEIILSDAFVCHIASAEMGPASKRPMFIYRTFAHAIQVGAGKDPSRFIDLQVSGLACVRKSSAAFIYFIFNGTFFTWIHGIPGISEAEKHWKTTTGKHFMANRLLKMNIDYER